MKVKCGIFSKNPLPRDIFKLDSQISLTYFMVRVIFTTGFCNNNKEFRNMALVRFAKIKYDHIQTL